MMTMVMRVMFICGILHILSILQTTLRSRLVSWKLYAASILRMSSQWYPRPHLVSRSTCTQQMIPTQVCYIRLHGKYELSCVRITRAAVKCWLHQTLKCDWLGDRLGGLLQCFALELQTRHWSDLVRTKIYRKNHELNTWLFSCSWPVDCCIIQKNSVSTGRRQDRWCQLCL